MIKYHIHGHFCEDSNVRDGHGHCSESKEKLLPFIKIITNADINEAPGRQPRNKGQKKCKGTKRGRIKAQDL
jgi:hypothetical protein